MMQKTEKHFLGQILIWTALLATLIVAPSTAYDPINVPKLALIAFGGFSSAGILVSNFSVVMDSRYRTISLLLGLFILDLLIVLFFSGSNFYQGLFGTFGRSTGFVAYISLTFLFLSALFVSSKTIIQKFSITLLVAGLLSSIYGLFQSIEIEPFSWSKRYSPVIGFLGNPNFQSSFLGFTGIVAFAFVLSKEIKKAYKLSVMVYLVLTAHVINQTDSQQGFLVLLGGIGIVILIWIPTSKIAFLKYPSLFVGFFVVIFVTLGSLNKGPLGTILYKPSVIYRGDYWRAGWKMTTDHPFLGVGLDGYGDFYRRARTMEATLRRGPEITSNSAHNVFLDLSSNGGFPLLFIYLALLLVVMRSIAKILKRTKKFDAPLTGLISVWFAYLAQSMISINQLGLAVWGWIISGLIIGYEINTRISDPAPESNVQKRKGKTAKGAPPSKISDKTLITVTCGLLVGSLMGLPPMVASSKYLTALKSFDAKAIEESAFLWPYDANRMGQVAVFLANNKLQDQAMNVLLVGVGRIPDDYELWRIISEIPSATVEQKIKAQAEMKRLDPLNPNLK
jgi:O-antigen ligase